MEGLGDVIIGACVETLHLVAPAVARGQDQDRHDAAGLAPVGENGNAVPFRQPEIEHDGVIGLRIAQKPAFLAIEGAIDGIAGKLQRRDDLAIEILVVLDHEQAH